MSRTYRRKSGNQWWLAKNRNYIYIKKVSIRNPTPEEIDVYIKEQVSIYQRRDYHERCYSKFVKWHSNFERRSCKRQQLSLLAKYQDYNNFDYDNSKELLTKRLKWVYD